MSWQLEDDDDPFDDPLDRRPNLPAEALALVRNWQRHASGDWGRGHHGSERSLPWELDWYRRNRSEVFRQLVDGDHRALRIAREAGWLTIAAKPRVVADNDNGGGAA